MTTNLFTKIKLTNNTVNIINGKRSIDIFKSEAIDLNDLMQRNKRLKKTFDHLFDDFTEIIKADLYQLKKNMISLTKQQKGDNQFIELLKSDLFITNDDKLKNLIETHNKIVDCYKILQKKKNENCNKW